MMRELLLWGACSLVIAGCAGDGGTGPLPPETTLSATPTASGNEQLGRITTTLPLPLRVVVDSAGVKKAGVTVTWHTSAGVLVPHGATDAAGIAAATWTLDAVPGEKSATATVAGLNMVTFGATALGGPTVFVSTLGRAAFVSAQNGSTGPAVDTILAGGVMTWILKDTDRALHRVVSVGAPSFPSSDLFAVPYDDLQATVTITAPGTYHYADLYNSAATGIIVVR
jgi:plastocyanin